MAFGVCCDPIVNLGSTGAFTATISIFPSGSEFLASLPHRHKYTIAACTRTVNSF